MGRETKRPAEPDANDTIAGNRAIPVMRPEAVPLPPRRFKPTPHGVRRRRLRRLSAAHRAEACAALEEAAARDLQAELGRFAPSPERAGAILERLRSAADLAWRAALLTEYAREVEEIAIHDAVLFLEAEHRQLKHALAAEPSLRSDYLKVLALFAARGGAVAEGIARAKAAKGKAPAPEGAGGEGE